jgi:hypothetical protein
MRLMFDVERVISRLWRFEFDWDDMIWSNCLVSIGVVLCRTS